MIVDASSYLVSVRSNFSGARVGIFGTLDDPGDIILVIRGPDSQAIVRKKETLFGIWLNRQAVAFSGLPLYYAVAANRALEEIASQNLLNILRIGNNNLPANPRPLTDTPPARRDEFVVAFLNERREKNLYNVLEHPVRFLSPRFFRTDFTLPVRAPAGVYRAEAYLLRDGQVISGQSVPFYVEKVGIEQEIQELADTMPGVFSLGIVVLCVAGGLFTGLVFGRA